MSHTLIKIWASCNTERPSSLADKEAEAKRIGLFAHNHTASSDSVEIQFLNLRSMLFPSSPFPKVLSPVKSCNPSAINYSKHFLIPAVVPRFQDGPHQSSCNYFV